MIAPKNLTDGTEFVLTVGVCAFAGLVMFLLVVLFVSALGLV